MKEKSEIQFENMEQYDYLDDEIIENNLEKYAFLIGSFIMKFSCLDHELNVAIADTLEDDFHHTGYVITERITINNKIDLFYKLNLARINFNDNPKKNNFVDFIKSLRSINEFRNSLVHAYWQTLSKKGYVRTRISIDQEEGWVKFKNIQITPQIIRKKIKEISTLLEKLSPDQFR